ncbi:MAG: helix-turn-helix domain-containing protein, partial [Clostridia bacterium]
MSLFGNLYDEELPSRAKIVYMNLKDRADKDGKCFPSVKRIARDTSLSVSTVKRAINDLVKAGYIAKERRVRENFGDTSNYYYIKEMRKH